MNIREAKEEIKKSAEIYLDKNEFGEYTIPMSRQRPLFLTGGPGIGKRAAVQQTASELDIAFLPCSMGHYTQQNILGRPVIRNRDYDGKRPVMPEYTMSEILAAVYRVMRDSGKREGILFLDEINCVSETLASDLLLFLRDKTFGEQQLPPGWVVIAAGSPPQYDKSAREFDGAAVDRLRRIDITEDFSVWKQYACSQGIHAAVISFLESHSQCFYSLRFTLEGMQYATARGWEDLAAAIGLYEKKGFAVDRKLIGQYITDAEIAGKFGAYYEQYRKCRSQYPAAAILSGGVTKEMSERAKTAGTEERFCILGLLMEMLGEGFCRAAGRKRSLQITEKALAAVRKAAEEDRIPVSILVQEQADLIRKGLRERTAANNLAGREKEAYLGALRLLEEYGANGDTADLTKDLEKIEKQLAAQVKSHEEQLRQARSMHKAAAAFVENVWSKTTELPAWEPEQ